MEISNVHRRQVLLGLAALATGPLWASAAAAQSGAPDFALIYHAAQLANEAYDGSSTILGDNPGGQGYIATPGRTDVQYFLLTNDKKKVQAVAVRGSDNNVNWSLDMDTMGDDDAAAGILMHAGFRQAAEAIWQDVRPRIKKGYTVYLTGHSLGGAVAAILGIYMRKAGIKVGGIITFGQPKFTNLAGAEHYADLPLVRIIYQNDIVSLLPPEFNQTNQRFAHLGTALNIFDGPYYTPITEQQAFQYSTNSFQSMMTQSSVPDHHLEWYLASLAAKQNGAIAVPFAQRNQYIHRHRPNDGPTSGLPGQDVQQNFGSRYQQQ
ncbi:MAG: lipase family protein [Hyphomicrobiales bacterium]